MLKRSKAAEQAARSSGASDVVFIIVDTFLSSIVYTDDIIEEILFISFFY